ncbi:MAG: hypothetical protein JWO07_659 [Candidatus Saccharibacteria bacterium]|nr:hypothetical protein [Candidatus Saccharibacteria bacterium]
MSSEMYTVQISKTIIDDELVDRRSVEFVEDADPELVWQAARDEFGSRPGCTLALISPAVTPGRMTILVNHWPETTLTDDFKVAVRGLQDRIAKLNADEDHPLNAPCNPDQHVKRVQDREAQADR